MKLNKIKDRLLHFEFPNNRDMTLTFFRVEEHYESAHANIREQTFSVYDFLETYTEENGEFGYFENVYGFNVPGASFKRFYERHAGQLTAKEQALLEAVKSAVDYNGDFYIIATKQDDDSTIDHEISHAIYYFNQEYRDRVAELVKTEIRLTLMKEMQEGLRRIGYADDVFEDEIQAFFASTKTKYLREHFDCSVTKADRRPFIKLFEEFKDKF